MTEHIAGGDRTMKQHEHSQRTQKSAIIGCVVLACVCAAHSSVADEADSITFTTLLAEMPFKESAELQIVNRSDEKLKSSARVGT
jgi:hypothetical protein